MISPWAFHGVADDLRVGLGGIITIERNVVVPFNTATDVCMSRSEKELHSTILIEELDT